MRVGCGRKWDSFPHGEFNNSIARIKFIDRFAPAGGGKFNREVAQTDQVERFDGDCVNLRRRSMSMDFNEIEVSEAIDKPSRRHFADAAKVIRINAVNIASLKLLGAGRDAVEHLVAIKEMNGSQNKIELVPMLLDPFSSRP